MNKQPISIQPSSTSDTRAVLSDAGTKSELNSSPQTFTAKNVVIKSDSLQMEVELNGRWQPMRLAINNGSSVPLRIDEALVTVNNNGQTLTLKTPEQSVQIKAANELLSLLNLLKNQPPNASSQHQASIIEKPHPQLHFKKLGMSLAINPALAQVLKNEAKLIASIHASGHKISFTLFNQFEDKLLTGTISKQKVIDLLSVNKQAPLMLIDKQSVQVKFTQSQQPLKLSDAVISSLPSSTSAKWLPVEISKQMQGIKLSQIPQSHLLTLTQPVKRQFSDVTNDHAMKSVKSTDTPRPEATLNYSKPFINISLEDIKHAVKVALQKWVCVPFSSPNSIRAVTHTPLNTPTFTPQLMNQLSPNMVRISAQQAIQPPIVQLMSQLTQTIQDTVIGKSSQASSVDYQHNTISLKEISNLLPATQKNSLPASMIMPQNYSQTPYVPKLPLERALLSAILAIKPHSPISTKETPDISPKIDGLHNYKSSNSIDLTRLVNNAFSRMINEENATPAKITQELQPQLAQLFSSQINTAMKTATSFTQALDKLLVTLIAAPKAIQGYSESEQLERLHTLLKTLTPEFKSVQPNKMLQNLPHLQSQLVDDLIQINNASHNNAPQNAAAAKYDSDAQLLLSLFLPMKLPAECKQTEVQIGQYKKKAKENMPEKTVWFIRLNFDYANQGKISAHAELMDKALDLQLLASTEQARQLAAPHIDGLRRKLSAHGLQVSDIGLSENAEHIELFFNSHTIVNIKV
ncbi:hypothetical protein PCIT_a0469 [Pseudoalteromonas citrea]|uniref:Flagellar hook-length control protein-like C-terminal domain-containing protein n=2 Tax=Pseudoalteromonas citrea TaxID=43655 RepID=A0AAD4AKM0_9GAMM|nr:flagellar hook-length control protein FliK [Pseudoalteromonas citrea]KAF7774078.1 hypothetical protein PCIT_a0469 [Pseudoalteromonas citrea]